MIVNQKVIIIDRYTKIYNATLSLVSGGWQGWNLRVYTPVNLFGLISKSENMIRMSFKTTSGTTMTINSCWIGYAGAGSYTFDGNQVQLFFNKSASVDINGATTITSDYAFYY